MRFGKNNVLCAKYIDIYEFWGVQGGTYILHCTILFIIQKNGKSTRTWPILKSNSTSFWFKKLPRINNKKFIKREPLGAQLIFLYEVRIVVLIDFIVILLTPGIFLIQIVNTNNTNMSLIHFHSKNNIKIRFPKKLGFKVWK